MSQMFLVFVFQRVPDGERLSSLKGLEGIPVVPIRSLMILRGSRGVWKDPRGARRFQRVLRDPDWFWEPQDILGGFGRY